jgi:hypothetical protein
MMYSVDEKDGERTFTIALKLASAAAISIFEHGPNGYARTMMINEIECAPQCLTVG